MYNKFVTSDGGKKDLRCLTMNTGKLLEVRNLQKFYNKDGVPTKALNGITFDVFPGEYLGIMGASGSGNNAAKLHCNDHKTNFRPNHAFWRKY